MNEENYEKFREHVSTAAEKFKQLDENETVRIISHYDADGISSASILVKLMNLLKRKYALSIVQQLNKQVLKELSNEEYKIYIFSDLGSGQYEFIKEILKDRSIFILDHHISKSKDFEKDNIVQLNPHLSGIDGGMDISGAGVCYLFGKELDSRMEKMSHIALIGAIADNQTKNGLSKLNNEILQAAVKAGKIEIKKGPRFFGMQTKPLYKLLQYSTDPYIPEITGSENNSIQFLKDVGINPKTPTGWKKAVELTEEEMEKLTKGIISKRKEEIKPEDIYTNHYILTDEEDGSPLRDAREFSTLLNACGRMDKSSLGIGTCIGDEKMKKAAVFLLEDYRNKIIEAVKWYEENKRSNDVISEDGFVIINLKDDVTSSISGTLASVLSTYKEIKKGTYIMTMARNFENKTTKISMRIAHDKKGCNVKDILEKIAENFDHMEYGGHEKAAGALFSTEKEKEFIESATLILRDRIFEESVS
ncbi:DHH family phosphoesterase [Candidatus Woesearchaeota archaeon]|nr:DHH family phosphoesterase [Candidatus Woesearchaeota archaeon]